MAHLDEKSGAHAKDGRFQPAPIVAAHEYAFQGPNGALPLEMLKMKEPPGMCMKTKETMTNCPAKNTTFTRKCSNCAIIDNNRSGFLS
jgi:hypothetical protein